MTSLSPREQTLLCLVEKNHDHFTIGLVLGISEEQAGREILALFDRLGVSNQTDAVVIAQVVHGFDATGKAGEVAA